MPRRGGRFRHGRSIKAPAAYEHMRKKGYSKRKAAKISNSLARRGKGIRHSPGHRSTRRRGRRRG